VRLFRHRAVVALLLTLLVGGLLAFALWPRPEPVSLAHVEHGTMRVSVQDEGRTRVRELYTVTAPVAGKLERIALDPGDPVTAEQTVVARIHQSDAPFLDPRAVAETQARVAAARAAVRLAEAELERARTRRDYARRDLDRVAPLAARGNVSQSRLDQAQAELDTARAEVAAAEAALQLRREELAQARAHLLTPQETGHDRGDCCVAVTAPVSGQVLQVVQESAGPVEAGAPLLTIGAPEKLEIVVELLSTDAVKVAPGAPAEIVGWGGDRALPARVRRVEPYGFTEVSALGIEEQRVKVLLDFAEPARAARLGHGFRVEARIVVWQADDVLQVPLGALFRDLEGRWATYAVADGRARLTRLEIGRVNDTTAQVLGGLDAGARVVLYPGDRIADGTRVAPEARPDRP
jgi:HlyD family secretion protein